MNTPQLPEEQQRISFKTRIPILRITIVLALLFAAAFVLKGAFFPPKPDYLPPVTPATFAREVGRAKKTVIVEFSTPGDAVCKSTAINLNKVCRGQHADLHVLRMRVDLTRDSALVKEFKLTALPTLIAYHHGNEYSRMKGALQVDVLSRWIAKVQ